MFTWAPALKGISQLSVYVQALVQYVAILPLMLVAIDVVRMMASFGLRSVAFLVKVVASQLGSDIFFGPVTAFVWLDAAARAVSPTAYDRKIYFWTENPRIEPGGPLRHMYRPALMIPSVYGLRTIAVVAGSFVVGVLSLIAIFGRSLVRPRIGNLLALFIAVGASGLASSAATLVTGASITSFPLGVIVAAGSLFALIYVLANSDIRGRAEFNKNASVQCRGVLHRNACSMLAVANTLESLRLAGMSKLGCFPTASEVGELASRQDLCLRRSYILPVGAGLFDHTLHPHFPLDSDAVAESAKFVADTAAKIESQIQSLYLDGVSKRLDRVLGLIGGGLMAALRGDRFGADSVIEIQRLGGAEWLIHLLDTSQLDAIRAAWVNLESVDPDSSPLRLECRALTKTFRYVLRNIHFVYWDVAVTESRLKWFSARIDKSLEPSLLERLRQYFVK